jgi:Glycosyl hydrolase family 57
MAKMTNDLSAIVDGLPNICGAESIIENTIRSSIDRPVASGESTIDLSRIRSAFAIALHMHQPLIPAGEADPHDAELISNLRQMMEGATDEQRYNAGIFRWCYKRMAEFILQLVGEEKRPRVMLDYSGTLLWGLQQMGLDDVLGNLRTITCEPRYRGCVEWLGSAWGHPVAPSTPVQDYRLHVRAWQHHFAALFGLDALTRVRGFSPAEMALPNHPDVAYEFVRTLKECGYRWVLVQEHTVEQPDTGAGPDRKHLPHQLLCCNSQGETAEIIAIIKTQGSDTKLVAQMQPYYEARGLSPSDLLARLVPPLVTQIADGENGGVMMNEFPAKYIEAVRECSDSETPMVNVCEYLDHLFAMGVREPDLPLLQPVFQSRIWDRFKPGDGAKKLIEVIERLQREDARFHVEGGSWTNNISWVTGYEKLVGPMEELSSLFYEKVLKRGLPTAEPRYRRALFHLLVSQTSCYRYWGEGIFVDYGREICRRGSEILLREF